MARSSVEVVRVEVLLPPALAAAVKQAAQGDGLRVGTWIASLCAEKVGEEYSPPPAGRPKKPARE